MAAARQNPPGGILVDLQNPGLDLPSLLGELRTVPGVRRVLAYGSHVDAESLRTARAAGCDPVLLRSQFVERLNGELATWLTNK